MPDWTKSMQQTFEYYIVDPGTWKDVKPINTVISSAIDRDGDSETLGSASFDVTEAVGEAYIRTYLVTVQNGVRERIALGTHLVQTPSSRFDGKIRNVSMDAYTPLIELKENQPPIGYYIGEGENIMERATQLSRSHMRGPVVGASSDKVLLYDFVSNSNDTWLTYLKDLVANANYRYALDGLGQTLYEPIQDLASMQPVWTYDDSNSSILYSDLDMDHDLYGVPNVVEVLYSNGRDNYYVKVPNDDPNSPVSTVNRGREIIYRVTNPDLNGGTFGESIQIKEYAKRLLRELSSIEYTLKYTHGYCPVRIGDCVRLNYSRAGLSDIKAVVKSQSIKCEPGCPVSETAVFTTNLWG